ncbi:hypothetical protein [Sphaerisporangium sp. NPDC051011]|uniref:hypothetical protein n=1 Tax=Sphaerisporangium sp. NPDC051011 TaxID=3155792 RepID=UPI0033BFFD24
MDSSPAVGPGKVSYVRKTWRAARRRRYLDQTYPNSSPDPARAVERAAPARGA